MGGEPGPEGDHGTEIAGGGVVVEDVPEDEPDGGGGEVAEAGQHVAGMAELALGQVQFVADRVNDVFLRRGAGPST